MHTTRWALAALLLSLTPACGDGSDNDAPPTQNAEPDPNPAPNPEPEPLPDPTPDPDPDNFPTIDYAQPGPHPVGRISFVIDDAERGRSFRVEVWYPATDDATPTDTPIETLTPEGPDRDTLLTLLAEAPQECPTRTVRDAVDAPISQAEKWPLTVASHCFQCARFSGLSIAAHMASHGIAVAAPDHTDDTIFDKVSGADDNLNDAFLQIRAGDIQAVLDALLDGGGPPALAGTFDPDRVGVWGHSFGAVTTGRVLQLDPRPRAGLALAAPMENPLFPSVKLADIDQPVLFVVAKEDNSITEIGNSIIRANFAAANTPAWKVEVDDAGHWSFSDICGLHEDFLPGCGPGERQTVRGQPFDYMPVPDGLAVARFYAAAFFDGHLRGNPKALDALTQTQPDPRASAEARP